MSSTILSIFFLFYFLVHCQGFSLEMKPILSILPQNITMIEKHQYLLQVSKDRAFGTQVMNNASVPINSSAVELPVSRSYSSFFYAQAMIGTPPTTLYLALETTTSPTWVQSSQCRKCFSSLSPNFDPPSSSSFQPMLYTDPICVPPFSRYNNTPYCSYEIIYSNIGGSSSGLFASDTFGFFSGEKEQQVAVPNMAFGTGIYNYISFPGNLNLITGVMGLRRGHPSNLLKQLEPLTLQKFAYCIPLEDDLRTTLLKFGEDAELSIQGRTDVQTTPIFGGPADLYYLRMNGASLSGKAVAVRPNYVVVDLAMPISRFVQNDYNVLRQEVEAYFTRRYGRSPLERSRSGYDLCYHTSAGEAFIYPSLTIHFQGGAKFRLSPKRMFEVFVQVNETCMLILPSGVTGPNVLGAFQQGNYRFMFDVPGSILYFAPEAC